MRKSNFTEEQMTGFLKQAEAGLTVVEICSASPSVRCGNKPRFGGTTIGWPTVAARGSMDNTLPAACARLPSGAPRLLSIAIKTRSGSRTRPGCV